MRIGLALLGAVFSLVSLVSPTFADEALVRLSTRVDVTQPFLLEIPPQPKAAVLLFAGGSGSLGLSERDGRATLASGNNFLVRSRHLFAQAGLIVATLDAPSDQDDGMDDAFRVGEPHAEDIRSVVSYLKNQASVPVWLVGTSRGTLSAANGALRLGQEIDGLVLSSSISRSGGRRSSSDAAPQGVLSFGLESLFVPVLVVAHASDGCGVTPVDDAPRILDRFEHAPRKALKILRGGDPPRSGPCEALSAHGYWGIEAEAVRDIADFILGHDVQ